MPAAMGAREVEEEEEEERKKRQGRHARRNRRRRRRRRRNMRRRARPARLAAIPIAIPIIIGSPSPDPRERGREERFEMVASLSAPTNFPIYFDFLAIQRFLL